MSNKTVAFFSYHVWSSKRRAGFHHLAAAFRRLGWDVLFVTTGISVVSYLKRDFRLKGISFSKLNKLTEETVGIRSYIHFTPIHSIGFKHKFLNTLLRPVVKYASTIIPRKIENNVSRCDIIIFESADGLYCYDWLKNINPNAKFIYRMSDLLDSLRKSPHLKEFEEHILSRFDLVSVPSAYAKKKLAHLPNVAVQFHGINKREFDRCDPSPYSGKNNVVFVGTSWRFDGGTVYAMAKSAPDITFHLIGGLPKEIHLNNVIYYGEMPYNETIKYLKYADVGLLPFKKNKYSAVFGDSSLKVMQYAYCQLPMLIPNYMDTGWTHAIVYDPSNQENMAVSVRLGMSKGKIQPGTIADWNDLALEFMKV